MRLSPLSAYTPDAVSKLLFHLGLRPEMVAPGPAGTPAGSRFGEPAIIADRRTGEMLGIISNVELGDFQGVAGLVIYVDEQRARGGYAMEAWWRYVARMFDLGVDKVQMEVMSFNTPVHRIMRKIGARPEVVLREHFYIGGRHWDGTLYGFDRQAWQVIDRRFFDVVRRPVALAGAPRGSDTVRSTHEGRTMNVDYLVFADAAIAADGKHYLHGAGWDTIVAPAFPVFHPQMSAALRLRLPPSETGRRLTVDVVDADGESLLAAPIVSDVGTADPGGLAAQEQVLCLAFNFGGLHFKEPGAYAVVVSLDGAEAHRAPFHVRPIPDSSAPQGNQP